MFDIDGTVIDIKRFDTVAFVPNSDVMHVSLGMLGAHAQWLARYC